MRRSTVRTATAVLGTTLALAATTAASTTAVAADGVAPTWGEFVGSTYQDDDRGYIVNGDEPARTLGDLRSFYDVLLGSNHGPTMEDGLIVNTVNGRDDVWSASQVASLTYCVSDRFRGDKARVVTAMNTGTGLWEAASSKINFTYVPNQDATCSTKNTNVTFSVEPTKTTQYIARAFFPSTPKVSRNILVNARSLYSSGSWTPGNIMGHELGHVLGLRHEHTRPEAGTCFEDNNWRPLTPYDSASIMHYPQCNGTSADLSMTDQDRAGIRALYGS